MKRNRRKGFTLIEVLLVVMILAMLAAFVVPNLMGAGDRARRGIAATAVGANGPIASALSQFKLSLGRFPTTDENLTALVSKPSGLEDNPTIKWDGPYITNATGLNDPWGRAYGYKCPGDVNTAGYDLWSNGEDGQPGTEDDIANWTRETGR